MICIGSSIQISYISATISTQVANSLAWCSAPRIICVCSTSASQSLTASNIVHHRRHDCLYLPGSCCCSDLPMLRVSFPTMHAAGSVDQVWHPCHCRSILPCKRYTADDDSNCACLTNSVKNTKQFYQPDAMPRLSCASFTSAYVCSWLIHYAVQLCCGPCI